MLIGDRARLGRLLSVELLPPRTEPGEQALRTAVAELAVLEPAFVAVTYGANGSDRGRTEELVASLTDSRTVALPHLTCAAHRKSELEVLLSRYRALGVENLLALHGDPPLSADAALPEGELRYAVELLRLARSFGFPSVGVAVHPEGHPAAPSRELDLAHQAAKLREADFALTQFVTRAEDYVRFVGEMLQRDAPAPIIPGLRIISTVAQAERMAAMSGAPVPDELLSALRAAGDDPEAAREAGIQHSVRVCQELLDAGAPGLHFYTMNRAAATIEVCRRLGLLGA